MSDKVKGANRDQEWPPPYPLDEVGDLPGNLTTTRLLVGFTVVVALVDLAMTGVVESSIPYNYHAVAAVVLTIFTVVGLKWSYSIAISLADELVVLAETDRDAMPSPDEEISGEQIKQEVASILNWGYRPLALGGSAIALTALGIPFILWLDIPELMPYLLVGILYGAVHGPILLLVPVWLKLLYKTVTEYIVDIDVLAPDGVGGYRELGDGIISLLSYGILGLTLDFVVVSAVSFVNAPLLQRITYTVYAVWLVFILAVAVGSVFAVRARLLEIRDAKVDELRDEFVGIESDYWQALDAGDDAQSEALNLLAMRSMFRELNEMDLWPINLVSLLKLASSTGGSLLVYAIEQGIISLPF